MRALMLKSCNLIHIGDIHYPDAKKEKLADIKDPAFPNAIADRARLIPLTCVARALTTHLEGSVSKALLLTGDLTSLGDASGYRDCLLFLNDLLNLKRWPADYVHVVPGNHDVDRDRVDPDGKDITSKFEEIAVAWRDLGLPILAVDSVRESSISVPRASTSGVTLFSLNSSLGCGERWFPKQIQDGLAKLLDDYASGVPRKEAFALLGETLDTPAFDQQHIENICETVRHMGRNYVPVVISHHNILPQALLRIAMYSELINAGVVRSRFSHLQRAIIYCHGHVHDYPVEIITEPEFPGSKLICVAAPTFSTGFNLISVEFSSIGVPLGCIVHSYRISVRDGDVRCTTLRIPFHSPTYVNVLHYTDKPLPNILANLPESDIRFPDLLNKLGTLSNQAKPLANALLEGEWLGMIELIDKEQQLEHWIIRKVVR
jgi:hypothetical protein